MKEKSKKKKKKKLKKTPKQTKKIETEKSKGDGRVKGAELNAQS